MPFVVLGTVCVVVAVIIACVQGTPITDYAAAAWELGQNLLAYGMVCFCMVLLAGLVGMVAYYVDWDVVLQVIKRVGGDFSNSPLTKMPRLSPMGCSIFFLGFSVGIIKWQ